MIFFIIIKPVEIQHFEIVLAPVIVSFPDRLKINYWAPAQSKFALPHEKHKPFTPLVSLCRLFWGKFRV